MDIKELKVLHITKTKKNTHEIQNAMTTHITRIRRNKKRNKKVKIHEDNVVKIPKNVLDRTLEIINNPQHDVWQDRNSACYKPIHNYENDVSGMRAEGHGAKMCLARTCLLQRDLRNLGKTLTITNPTGSRLDCRWYPLCVKYGVLSLAHSDRRLLNLFLQSLISSDGNEGLLERYTQHPSHNAEENDVQ